MPPLKQLWATDVDLLSIDPTDYHLLVPPSQIVCRGADGVVSTPLVWQLTSATVPFATRGVAIGMACLLTEPGGPGQRKEVHDAFAVAAAADVPPGGVLTLARTIGAYGPAGEPPSVGSGLRFRVLTLLPQIEQSTYEIDKRLRIDETYGIRYAELLDPRELRMAVAFKTLADRYLAAQQTADELKDSFVKKEKLYRQRFDAAIEGLRLTLTSAADRATAMNTIQGRLVR